MKKNDKIFDVIKNSTQNLSPSVIKKDIFLNKIPFELLNQYKIMSDEEYEVIMQYIKKFELDDPQKLIKWLIDLHFAAIENINDGIASIRSDLLTDVISHIYAMRDKISDINVNDDKSELYKKYIDEMYYVLRNLEGKIREYISDIKKIDNLPNYKFFLNASYNKSKVTTAVQLGKAALEAYFESLFIFAVLANERRSTDRKNDRFEESINFINSLELSYFLAYDKNKSSFWQTDEMIKKIKDAQATKDMLNDYLIAEQETEIDFENDINFEEV